MPSYAFLANTTLKAEDIEGHLEANKTVGVPYTEEMIENAKVDFVAQANPDSDAAEDVKKRYPKAVVSNFDGDAVTLTEMDAMVAYLQMLGTLVDFKAYQAKDNLR